MAEAEVAEAEVAEAEVAEAEVAEAEVAEVVEGAERHLYHSSSSPFAHWSCMKDLVLLVGTIEPWRTLSPLTLPQQLIFLPLLSTTTRLLKHSLRLCSTNLASSARHTSLSIASLRTDGEHSWLSPPFL